MRMHQTSRSPSPAIDFGAPPSPSIGTICVTHPPHIPSANVNPLYHLPDTSSQMPDTKYAIPTKNYNLPWAILVTKLRTCWRTFNRPKKNVNSMIPECSLSYCRTLPRTTCTCRGSRLFNAAGCSAMTSFWWPGQACKANTLCPQQLPGKWQIETREEEVLYML